MLGKFSNFQFSSQICTDCTIQPQLQHLFNLTPAGPDGEVRRYHLASLRRASWLAPLQLLLLNLSRHGHHHHPSSGLLPRRSSSLWCWDLRSCRLNCQSLWRSLIRRGGRPSMGGCDKHAHRYAHTGKRGRRANTAHIDTTGYAFMHDHTCTHQQVTHIGGVQRTKTSRHKHSSRDRGLASDRNNLSQIKRKGWMNISPP